MPDLRIKVVLDDITTVEAEALIVGFFEDVRPLKGAAGRLDWLLCSSLSRLLIQKKLRGALGDAALLTSRGKIAAPKIFLIGLGPKASLSLSTLRAAVKAAAVCVLGAGIRTAALEYFFFSDLTCDESLPALCDGLREGAGERTLEVALLAPDKSAYDQLSLLVQA